MRSKRNKTIDFTLEEASPELLNQIIQPTDNLQTISNKIINGDSFKVMTKLSPHQVDLALIDPPYNLNKQYDGLSFKKMSTSQYQAYTQKWIDLLKPLLKENASIYVFSDWATSMALAPILEKNFTIQNRITWQREKGRGSLKNWKNGMEDIWFLTANPSDYTFNVDQVKQRRQVVAPYRQDGVAKDWQATKMVTFGIQCRLIFGMTFQFRIGQCQKILVTLRKSLRNCWQKLSLPVLILMTSFLILLLVPVRV